MLDEQVSGCNGLTGERRHFLGPEPSKLPVGAGWAVPDRAIGDADSH